MRVTEKVGSSEVVNMWHTRVSVLVMAIALALPWLNPYTAGPSVSQWQWIASATAGCAAIAWASLQQGAHQAGVWKFGFAYSWLIAASLSSIIGLAQYLGWAHYLAPLVNVPNAGAAYGNLRQPNQFATLTNIGLLAVFWALQHVPTRHGPASLQQSQSVVPPWWGIALSVILAAGNAVSSSRTGMLQLVCLSLLCVWWWHGPARRGAAGYWTALHTCLASALAKQVCRAVQYPAAPRRAGPCHHHTHRRLRHTN